MYRTEMKIDRDYIAGQHDLDSVVGKHWQGRKGKPAPKDARIRWRMLDDDGNVYFGGWLVEGETGDPFLHLLDWGMAYAGCTSIQVLKRADVRVRHDVPSDVGIWTTIIG